MIEPWGAQRGTAVTLTLKGYGLTDELRVLAALPGAVTELTSERPGRELPLLVEIANDAKVGSYPIRIETEAGISNVLLFTVGPFNEKTESESETMRRMYSNDSVDTAEPATLPLTINGALRGADRDWYRVEGPAGDKVVVEVEARRLGSAIDATIEVRDSAGITIARNNDARGIGVDPRAQVTVPADGVFFVQVHDARFSEQRMNFYRLRVGRYMFAEAVFPLGWKRGESVDVQLLGGNLERPVTLKPDLSPSATATGLADLRLPDANSALPLRMVVGDDDEVLEPAAKGPHELKPSVVVNGRVASPGEADTYRLKVSPGEQWMIETQAAGLGTSALYGLLTLYGADGKKLASAGDQEPEEPLSIISSTGETFGDPHLGFEVPKGVSEVTISIEDLLGRGGIEYGYRIVARRQPPDFTLTLATPHVTIPKDGSNVVNVSVTRRGFMGAIRLVVDGLPDDVEARGGHIPAETGGMTTSRRSRRGVVTLTPKPDAGTTDLDLSVWGEATTEDGRTIRVRAQPPGMLTGVAGRGQKAVTAPWLAANIPARVAEPERAVLKLLTPQTVRLIQGMETDVLWEFDSESVSPVDRISVGNTPAVGNIRVTGTAKVKEGAKSGQFTVVTTMGTLPMKFDLIISAQTMIDGREQTIYAPALIVDVVQGYRIDAPEQITEIPRGGRAEILGRFRRQPDFASPVTVKADNLPLGVKCSAAEISGAPEQYRLECEADDSAKPGDYEIELAPTSVLASRDTELVPYKIEPVTTHLSITKAGRMARSR
jgi:hypothetical protein